MKGQPGKEVGWPDRQQVMVGHSTELLQWGRNYLCRSWSHNIEFGIDEGVLAFPWVPMLRYLAGEPLRARTEPCKTLSVGLSIFNAPVIPTAVYVAYLSLSLCCGTFMRQSVLLRVGPSLHFVYTS